MAQGIHTVTGAFGYSGRYIASRLIEAGRRVRTLTNSPRRKHNFGEAVEIAPMAFHDPPALTEALRGTEVLYNTYWVRFTHGGFSHDEAVRNTETLFTCAREAGVGRVIHVSITNPSLDSPLPYFAGKARLEAALEETGLPHSILRPAVLFGGEDILINNMAWMLRIFPLFGVFGKGDYRLQPIHVEDFADLAVKEGIETEDRVVQAIGPETFTYRELVEVLGECTGRPRPIVSIPPALGLMAARVLGLIVRDVVITREEIEGLMEDLLCVDAPPAGMRRLTDWARDNAHGLGKLYASELARRRDRESPYGML